MNDIDLLRDIQKAASKKQSRWITCHICGKTITKLSMTKHMQRIHTETQAPVYLEAQLSMPATLQDSYFRKARVK